VAERIPGAVRAVQIHEEESQETREVSLHQL